MLHWREWISSSVPAGTRIDVRRQNPGLKRWAIADALIRLSGHLFDELVWSVPGSSSQPSRRCPGKIRCRVPAN